MRLFIALQLSPEVKTVLLEAAEKLRAQARGGNFTQAENLHLTLAFIGETEKLSAARAALDEAAGRAFPMAVGGTGRFGELWWAGIEKNPVLEKLAERVQEGLRVRGFPIERRPFRPHITLARQVALSREPILLVPHTEMTARRLSLMKSERLRGRLVYTEIHGRDLT
jgi:2'-5' RNA ligase